MPNRALVLSGGGSKGAFEVGAVDYLINDRGLDFDVIAGVSTGSLNAVILAQGAGPSGLKAQLENLKSLWFAIRSSDDIYKKRFLGSLLVFLSKDSMMDPSPLRQRLREQVDPARLAGSGRQLRVGATSLESGSYVSATQESPRVLEWTLASSSMPVFFPPVKIGEESTVDGGVRNVTPLEDAFRGLKRLPPAADRGADEIWVVLASPLEVSAAQGPWKNGKQIGLRALGLLENEIYREDFSYALAINEAVRFFVDLEERVAPVMGPDAWQHFLATHPYRFRPPQYCYVRVRAIVPDRVLSEVLEFNPEKIRQSFAAGREAARRPLDENELVDRLAARAPRRDEPAASDIPALASYALPDIAKPRLKRPAA